MGYLPPLSRRMPTLAYAGDVRLFAALVILALGAVFLLNSSRSSWSYARWLAGSAVIYGATLGLMRVGELSGVVSERAAAIGLPLSSLLAIGMLAAGLQAHFRPNGVPAGQVFMGVAVVMPVLIFAVDTALSGWVYAGPIATAAIFTAGAIWMFKLWWRDRWGGQMMLMLAFLQHPMLVSFGLAQGMGLQEVRSLMPLPLAVSYVFLMTLILQRDAQALDAELQQRARAEEELQRIAETLEATVDERTTELREIVYGLQSFSGMVSHDLSGPLRNAGALVQLARDAAQQGDSAELIDMLGRIERENQRAQSMVSDLLSLSRVEQAPLQVSPVDMQALLQECLASLGGQFPDASVVVHSDNLPVVQGDPGLLQHVLVNLVGNALKFGCARRDLSVSVRAQREGDLWRFTVSDNGPGFASERAGELFKPFSRLENTSVNGTGLGLTVVKRVVERLGGQVGAASSPGLGATFWWTLPSAGQRED